jgi:hypothetical protein
MCKTIIFFVIFLPAVCFSQFNDTTHYYLRFASTGIINKTNESNSYVLTNGLTFNTKQKNLSINTTTSWIYGALQHRLTNNDFSAQSYIDLFKGVHKLYYWGLINYDKSFSLKVNHRLQIGAGAAYNIIDSPSLRINVSDGFLYEQGNINIDGTNPDVYQIPRNSFRLLYHFSFKEKLIIDGIHFFQPSLKSFNDYIIQSSNNVSVKLHKWLSVTAAFMYNRVSRTKRENILFTYGLTFEKYF